MVRKMIKLKNLITEGSQKMIYDNMSGYIYVNTVAFSKHDIVELDEYFSKKHKFMFTKQFELTPKLKIHDKVNGGVVLIDEKTAGELRKYAKKIGWDKITGRND